ncbi:MAG: nucleotide exchange factor GrpE [Spirochaetaceae bacterium]|jgi:molecular chaperone GrpE|nr:nucleotide exchange factor GrpE [Spirochaetaceae bacterium]
MKDEEKAQGSEAFPEDGEALDLSPEAEAADSGADPAAESAGAPPRTEEAPPEQSPEDRIAALEAQAADLRDQYLRKAADFDNYRKRMNREKQDAIEFANQNLILDLIPVIDDFERAIKAAEAAAVQGTAESKDFNALYEGISMTEKRLISQLENRWGLKRYDSAGEPFDPNRHEAIMMEKSTEVSEPTVAEDFLKGYTLQDRVIRAAKVKVLMPGAEEGGAD